MMSWKVALTAVALVSAWAGCGDPDAIGTHMIVNPATASNVEFEVDRPTLAFADTVVDFEQTLANAGYCAGAGCCRPEFIALQPAIPARFDRTT